MEFNLVILGQIRENKFRENIFYEIFFNENFFPWGKNISIVKLSEYASDIWATTDLCFFYFARLNPDLWSYSMDVIAGGVWSS